MPDVVQALSTAQNITILAPSDTAFVNLMTRNPRSSELLVNQRALTGVLQYHVLTGKLLSGDFSPTPKFPATLLGAPFANVTGGQRVGLVMANNTAKVFSGYKQVATVVTAVCNPPSSLVQLWTQESYSLTLTPRMSSLTAASFMSLTRS